MKRVKYVNIAFMCAAFAPYIFVEICRILKITSLTEVESVLIGQILYVLPAIVYLVFFRKKVAEEGEATTLAQTLRIKKIRISSLLLIALFTYCMYPLISLVNAISLVFANNEIQETVSSVVGGNQVVVSVLLLAALPAICEELMYRGVIYNAHRKVSPRAAIFMSALLFGLLHRNLNQFSYAFLLGILLVLVIEATDSILASVFMHVLINSTSVILNYALPYIQKTAQDYLQKNGQTINEVMNTTVNVESKEAMMQTIGLLILPAIIFTFFAFIIYQTLAKRENRYEHVKNIFAGRGGKVNFFGLVTIPLAIGAVLCIYDIMYLLLYS